MVADELYNEKVYARLDNFINKYELKDKIYLMSISEYPKNNGLFNIKRRYREFTEDLCSRSDIPLGYVNYIFIKEGTFDKALPYVDKIQIDLFP